MPPQDISVHPDKKAARDIARTAAEAGNLLRVKDVFIQPFHRLDDQAVGYGEV